MRHHCESATNPSLYSRLVRCTLRQTPTQARGPLLYSHQLSHNFLLSLKLPQILQLYTKHVAARLSSPATFVQAARNACHDIDPALPHRLKVVV
jgi:hypothetical protein